MADQTPRIRKNPKIKTAPDTNEPEVAGAMGDLIAAKARKELALAESAEIELQLAKKHLIIRDDVSKTIFEESRNLRDRLHQMSTKLAPKLSNMTKADEIKKLVKASINDVLRIYTDELSKRL